ncbi:pantothenate kinase [Phormidesmis sp. 146-35]
MSEKPTNQHWLALIIGNSRLHWGWFIDDNLQQSWDTSYLSESIVENLIHTSFDFAKCQLAPISLPSSPELWIASVVPQQTALWQIYSQVRTIAPDQISLQNAYSTLGLDRTLAIWGASDLYKSPVLVIDGGTALTFTGANEQREFIGGAILPGLQLQFRAVHQATAALPLIETKTLTDLPSRWATGTIAAIQSGIVYSLISTIRDFIEDWQQQFPNSALVLTGGDSARLHHYLEQRFPKMSNCILLEPNLLFWGVRSVRQVLSR